jgi:hypothetical protein
MRRPTRSQTEPAHIPDGNVRHYWARRDACDGVVRGNPDCMILITPDHTGWMLPRSLAESVGKQSSRNTRASRSRGEVRLAPPNKAAKSSSAYHESDRTPHHACRCDWHPIFANDPLATLATMRYHRDSAILFHLLSRAGDTAMKRRLLPPLARWISRAVIMLWVTGLIAPSIGQASCARHYTSPTNETGIQSSRFDRLSLSGALSTLDSRLRLPESQPHRSPCPAGICSSAPGQPPAPAPAPPLRVEHWGCLINLDPPVVNPSLDLPFEDPARHPLCRGPFVFHPPRFA